MPDRIPELTRALAAAEAAVKDLSKTVNLHQSTLRRVKATFVVAFLGLILALGVGGYGVWNQHRINTLQHTLQVETERNRDAQCAMVLLFLQFEPRTTTNPAYTEDQRAQQVQAYATLRQIGLDLGCADK